MSNHPQSWSHWPPAQIQPQTPLFGETRRVVSERVNRKPLPPDAPLFLPLLPVSQPQPNQHQQHNRLQQLPEKQQAPRSHPPSYVSEIRPQPPSPQQQPAQLSMGSGEDVEQRAATGPNSPPRNPNNNRINPWQTMLPWQARFNAPLLVLIFLILIFAGSFTGGWYSCKHAHCGGQSQMTSKSSDNHTVTKSLGNNTSS